jgi:hypothetical protein
MLALTAWLAFVGRGWLRRVIRRVPVRDIPSVLGAVAIVVGPILVLSPDLGGQVYPGVLGPALPAVCLSPVAVWLGIVTWRRLNSSRHVLMRAGADVALSLPLGVALLLVLVAAANLFGLSPHDVEYVRRVAEQAKGLTDVHQVGWLLLYVALALVGVAIVVWASSLERLARWFAGTRLIPALGVGRRVASTVHTALLVSTLLGVAVPPALEPVVRADLRSSYEVALRDHLDAEGRRAEYEAIRRSFAGQPVAAPRQAALVTALGRVRDLDTSARRGDRATVVELDLAWRIGELQARLASQARASAPLSSEAAVADLRDLARPIGSASELDSRLDRVAHRQAQAQTSTEVLKRTAELAVAAVVNSLFPSGASSELLQVVQEYISGIVESGPVKDIFVEDAERREYGEPAAHRPPDGARLVLFDPALLLGLARAQERTTRRFAAIPDASRLDSSELAWLGEPPAASAVEFLNETRVIEETGICLICGYGGPPELRPRTERGGRGPGGSGAEPPRIEPPRVEPHPVIP